MHVLDNPVWSALAGPQRGFCQRDGSVARFDPAISLFGAFVDVPGPGDWRDMARFIAPGGVVITTGCTGTPPEGWGVGYDGEGVQMTGEALAAADLQPWPGAPEVVPLGPDDVDDMLELVDLARPGPFTPRTYELGGYVGVRRDGLLVAMAGERLRPDGWAEISAVATHPDHRREGLGELLVRAVAAGIVARGEVPFLHAAAVNDGAIRLYRTMGFTVRRHCRFVAAVAPDDIPSDPPASTVTPPGR